MFTGVKPGRGPGLCPEETPDTVKEPTGNTGNINPSPSLATPRTPIYVYVSRSPPTWFLAWTLGTWGRTDTPSERLRIQRLTSACNEAPGPATRTKWPTKSGFCCAATHHALVRRHGTRGTKGHGPAVRGGRVPAGSCAPAGARPRAGLRRPSLPSLPSPRPATVPRPDPPAGFQTWQGSQVPDSRLYQVKRTKVSPLETTNRVPRRPDTTQ